MRMGIYRLHFLLGIGGRGASAAFEFIDDDGERGWIDEVGRTDWTDDLGRKII